MRAETLSLLQVPAFNIGVMSDVLESANIDPAPAFLKIGLDPTTRLPLTGFVSARAELEFENAFLELTPNRRDLWAEVGRRHKLYAYGTFGLAIGTSPTLRDWVKIAEKTRDLYFTFTEYRAVERDGDLCGIEFRLDSVPKHLREMTLYRDLGAASSIIGEVWQASKRGFCVELAASAASARCLSGLFPFKVKFDCPRTMLTWPARLTDVGLPNGSAYLHRYYAAQYQAILDRISGSDLQATITRVIMLRPSAHSTIEAVASRLNMSVRTLQRRLGDHGMTFRKVLTRAHTQVAKFHLGSSSLSIAQIAAQLGYADRTSFDLAFSRWIGVSPRRYRDAVVGSGSAGEADIYPPQL